MGPGASLYTERPENFMLLPQISPDHAVHILVTALMMFPQILQYSGYIKKPRYRPGVAQRVPGS
jgi:hypothetical protein